MDLKLSVLLQTLDKATAPLKKVQQASKAAAEQLKKTRDTLRQLDEVQKKAGEFRTLKQGTRDTVVRMKDLQVRINTVAREMRETDRPTAALSRQFKRLTAEARDLKAQKGEQIRKLQQLRAGLAAAGVDTRNLGVAETRLRTQSTAATRAVEQQTAALRAQGTQAQQLVTLRERLARGQAMGANLSIAGYAAMQTGRHLIDQVQPAIHEAKIYQTNLAQLRAQGVSNADVAQAERFVRSDTTRGSSINDKMEILKDANSIFRDMHEAVQVAPSLLKAKYTFESLMAEHGEGGGHGQETVNQLIDAIRTGELRNATKTPEDFQHLLDMMSRAYVGSGGLVKPSDYLETMKVGGVAAKLMDEKALFFGAMHTIQEMGGMRAGTGFASAYQNWAAGRSTQQTAEALAQLGLVNKDAVKYGKNGHITKMLPGALKNQTLYESNPFEYMMTEVIPRINPTGKLTDDQVVSKLNALFSARKGGDLFAGMFMQRANIQKQLDAASKFAGLDDTYRMTGDTAVGQEADLEAEKRNLYLTLGREVLPLYVAGLRQLVTVLKTLTEGAQKHPAIAKGLMLLAGGLGVLMVSAGGLMVVLGGLIGQFALLRFAMERARLGWAARGGAAADGEAAGVGMLARLGGLARNVFPVMATGARAAMLAITGVSWPVLALIAAVVALGVVVWKYWKPIKAFFVGIGLGLRDELLPALAALGAVLAPLKPAWDAITDALGAVWRWIVSLFEPFQATSEQLASATAHGVTFGRVLGVTLAGVVTAITWTVQAFTWLGTKIGECIGWIKVNWSGITEVIKQPFATAFRWISDKIDWLLDKWRALKASLGQDGPSGNSEPRTWEWNDGRMPPSRFAIDDRPPLKAGNAGSTITNTYAVTVHAAPGADPHATARAVSAELDRRERAKAAANRSRLSDSE
ncbi:hypothetical protein [Dyella acidisoli]|uniref:Bacteriophage membrane protein n=1 Tax=Dyella acidisoli TaxID=1867834 RepID=A0ABQ5XPZ2_9GAMM|nr:hypothetical protein [Dyella acidisoli]GLQ93447.1 bacteriophage membrane protein [Dyella acidisoli]